MGEKFVVMIENRADRTQEETCKELGVRAIQGAVRPTWELFDFRGRRLAKWSSPPRFFLPEEEPARWEAIRKYIVRVRRFFGDGDVLVADTACWWGLAENGKEDAESPGCYLPGPMMPEHLMDPDFLEHPELRDIGELEGTVW